MCGNNSRPLKCNKFKENITSHKMVFLFYPYTPGKLAIGKIAILPVSVTKSKKFQRTSLKVS